MTAAEQCAALRAGKVSSVELVAEALRKAAESPLNAFITFTEEEALRRAEESDRERAQGKDRGPLHGIPIAHKDCLFTKGVRTTWGSKVFADFVPDRDAEAVRLLADAGALSIGKTNLHELTYGMTSANPHFGAVRNPHDLERSPGGSSGGSGAAVAAGIVAIATGTDTGGSIRIPASFCGVVGFKPSFDAVSRAGCFPLGLTLDHVGPLAANVADATWAFQAMQGNPLAPLEPSSLEGLRIGLPRRFFFDRLDPAVRQAVRESADALANAGARIVEVDPGDAAELNQVGRVIQLVEAAAVLEKYIAPREMFGADVLALFDQGRLLSGTAYVNAQRVRRILAEDFDGVWSQCDVLLAPATPMPAPRIGQTTVDFAGVPEDVRMAGTRLTRPFNVLGWPVVSLPCGKTKEGLPLGLQWVGAMGTDYALLRTAATVEAILA